MPKLSSYNPNIYPTAKIGKKCKIHKFAFIEGNVTIGDNCKIKPFVFIAEGTLIGDGVFIGPNTNILNDLMPRATTEEGKLKTKKDWKLLRTIVRDSASIGAGSTINAGVIVGRNAIVRPGSVVTTDVPEKCVVEGNPAKTSKYTIKNLNLNSNYM